MNATHAKLTEAMGGDLLIDYYGGEWLVLDRGAVTKHDDGMVAAYSRHELQEADKMFGPFVEAEGGGALAVAWQTLDPMRNRRQG